MNVVLLSAAAQELKDAITYYEERDPGLGMRLRDEVNRCILWISDNSEVPRVRGGKYRRANLRVFPYYIAFLIKDETIWVLAVASSHRRPEYWVDRG